jgi:DMSO/TMAO reductase YedYZ molybdopterin-dependent catalytic subunit
MKDELPWSRRSFLKKSVISAMTLALGTKIVYASNLREGYLPVIFAQEENPLTGKVKGMLVLNERPWNVETPAHLLDDPITPTDKMFIRNNGLSPTQIDVASWTLTIDGEAVQAPKTYTLDEL